MKNANLIAYLERPLGVEDMSCWKDPGGEEEPHRNLYRLWQSPLDPRDYGRHTLDLFTDCAQSFRCTTGAKGEAIVTIEHNGKVVAVKSGSEKRGAAMAIVVSALLSATRDRFLTLIGVIASTLRENRWDLVDVEQFIHGVSFASDHTCDDKAKKSVLEGYQEMAPMTLEGALGERCAQLFQVLLAGADRT